MVVVAVAQDDGVQIVQIHAQLVGIVQGRSAGTAVKQDAAAVIVQKQGQSMLRDQGLMLRWFVVHQCCDV